MSNTMLSILQARAERIREAGVRLLGEFSGMHPVNTPGDSIVLISPSGDHFWNPLPSAGKQMQTQLLPEINRFAELVQFMTRALPETAQERLREAFLCIGRAIEQNGKTWWKTNNEAVEEFRKSINELIATLREYCATSAFTVLVIPDTNALLGSPDVEHWQFEDVDHFFIILTPTVLSELDNHKINHRNQDVRDRASKLIRKIKEYRRRGSLLEGVVIITGCISLRAIASEPDMSQTLSWLDSTNADDRFLATSLDVITSNLGSRVFIVTSDINMQNKAEMAGILFQEVPAQGTERKDG